MTAVAATPIAHRLGRCGSTRRCCVVVGLCVHNGENAGLLEISTLGLAKIGKETCDLGMAFHIGHRLFASECEGFCFHACRAELQSESLNIGDIVRLNIFTVRSTANKGRAT